MNKLLDRIDSLANNFGPQEKPLRDGILAATDELRWMVRDILANAESIKEEDVSNGWTRNLIISEAATDIINIITGEDSG